MPNPFDVLDSQETDKNPFDALDDNSSAQNPFDALDAATANPFDKLDATVSPVNILYPDFPGGVTQMAEANRRFSEPVPEGVTGLFPYAQPLKEGNYFEAAKRLAGNLLSGGLIAPIVEPASSYVANVARGGVADVAAVEDKLIGSNNGKETPTYTGNLVAALKGEPLPIDEAINSAGADGHATEAVIAKISQGLAGAAPIIALTGKLPADVQGFVGRAFVADMLVNDAATTKALYDEFQKPPAQRDQQKINDLVAQGIQDTGFLGLAGYGALRGHGEATKPVPESGTEPTQPRFTTDEQGTPVDAEKPAPFVAPEPPVEAAQPAVSINNEFLQDLQSQMRGNQMGKTPEPSIEQKQTEGTEVDTTPELNADFEKRIHNLMVNGDMGEARRLQRERAAQTTVEPGGVETDPIGATAPEATGTTPFSKATEEGQGIDRNAVHEAVQPLVESMPTAKVRVVQSESELPDHLQDQIKSQGASGRVEGVFDPETGTVHLVADNLESPQRAVEVLFHEVVAHDGLRRFFGDRFDDFMDRVFDGHWDTDEMRSIADDYGLDLSKLGDRRTAADEFCARLAENPNINPTLWTRIVAHIKAAWRAVTGSDGISEEEIRVALAKSRRNLERSSTTETQRAQSRFSLRDLNNEGGSDRPEWLSKEDGNEVWNLARKLVNAGDTPDHAIRVAFDRLQSVNGFEHNDARRWVASMKPTLEGMAKDRAEFSKPAEPAPVPESGTQPADAQQPPVQSTRVQQLRDRRLAELERLNKAQQQIRALREANKQVPAELNAERKAAREAVIASKQMLRNDVEHAEALHMDLNAAGGEYSTALKSGEHDKIWPAEGKLHSIQAEVEDLPAKIRDQALDNLYKSGRLKGGNESTWQGDPSLKPPGWDENWDAPRRKAPPARESGAPIARPEGDPEKPQDPYYGMDSWPRGGLGDIARDLRQWQRRLAAWWKGSGTRSTMTYLFDGAMGRARNIARMGGGKMLHELNRAFGITGTKVRLERDPLREAAFAFAIEADGDRSKLGEWHDLIAASDHAGTKQGRQALAAIAFAEKHWDKFNNPLGNVAGELSLVELHQEMTALERGSELNAGLDVPEWEGNYVKHAASPDEMGVLQSQDQGGGIGQGFTKKRLNPTLADDVAQGVPLKSLSAIDLLESRIRSGQENVNAISWLTGLKEMKDPTTQQPLITDVQTRFRGDKTPYDHVPAGYKIVQIGRVKFGILRGYDGVFGDLTNPSWFASGGGKRFTQKAIATGKHIVTFFDTMHLGVEATRNFLLTGKVTYSRGLTLLDNSAAELRRMAERGEIPKEWVSDLQRQKAILDLGVRQGVNLTDLSANLHRGWLDAIEHIPVIGVPARFNRWLFSNYVRGAMAQAYLLKYEQRRAAFPDEPEAVTSRTVGRDINSIFGSIGNQGLFRSKTGQDWARVFFFAPYWNETLARTELGGVGQLAKVPAESVKAGRLYMGPKAHLVGYGVLGLFAANQVINLVTRGKPTWDNDEEGFGAKVSAYIPDAGGGPGFFLNPFSLAMKLTHLLETKIERNLENSEPGFWSKTGAVVKGIGEAEASRMTPLGRAGLVPITRRDSLGRGLRDKEIVPEMLSTLIPKPMSSEAVYRFGKQLGTGEHQERYAGQFQRQLFSSAGVLLDQAPAAAQRISRLARSWNAEHGAPESAEFFHGDFEALDGALRRGNMTEAQDELESLLKKKTATNIVGHYSRRAGISPTTGDAIKVSFTGNAKQDAPFMASLNESQRVALREAIKDRGAMFRAVQQLLSARAKERKPVNE